MSRDDYKPWVEYSHIWKTESAYLSFIRGGIRRYLWSKNPVKLEFEKESQVLIPNDNPKSSKRFPQVKGFKCNHCGGLFKANQVQCDHRTGEHSLRSTSEIQSFIEGIVFIKKEDLQMLCKPCHAIKSYAERYGLTIAEAGPIKQAIDFEKKGVKKVIDFLEKSGIIPASTKEKRREQLIDYYRRNK